MQPFKLLARWCYRSSGKQTPFVRKGEMEIVAVVETCIDQSGQWPFYRQYFDMQEDQKTNYPCTYATGK